MFKVIFGKQFYCLIVEINNMNENSLRSSKKVVFVDFQNIKLQDLAREYVRLLAKYGIEAASLWSMDKLTGKVEQKQFNIFVGIEMRKCGFNVPKH